MMPLPVAVQVEPGRDRAEEPRGRNVAGVRVRRRRHGPACLSFASPLFDEYIVPPCPTVSRAGRRIFLPERLANGGTSYYYGVMANAEKKRDRNSREVGGLVTVRFGPAGTPDRSAL